MSERSVGLLLKDMAEAVARIARFTSGITADDFHADEKTSDAVVRNLEVDFCRLLPSPSGGGPGARA